MEERIMMDSAGDTSDCGDTSSPFKDRFCTMLAERFDGKKDWWEAVEAQLKKDEAFASKVAENSKQLQAEEEKPRKQIIVEVMVDILLDMEGITVHKGLMYVLEENLNSYPLELMATELLKRGADPNKERGHDGSTPLHLAIMQERLDIVKKLLLRRADLEAKDVHGWTPLQLAVYFGNEDAAKLLIQKGADVNASDYKRKTLLHIAAEGHEENMLRLLLDNKADTGLADAVGNTPLDIAAKGNWKQGFDILIQYAATNKRDEKAKRSLKKAMDGETVQDELVSEQVQTMSPFSVAAMLKSKECGGKGDYLFLQDFASNQNLKKSTRTIMDKFVLGKRRVNCEVLEADMKGVPPDKIGYNEKSRSLLDIVVARNDEELAQHPCIRALMDYKWKKYGRWLFALSALLYAVRMLLFGMALLFAARPDLDNPGCYRGVWDYFRGIFEGISLILFIGKFADEIREMHDFKKDYFKDHYNYLQLLSAILTLLIVPFRVATTWCASTGDGYCVDPTLLPNSTNITLDINQNCIAASHVQWIFASLAYMVNAMLVVEFLSLFRTTGVYMRILIQIILSDLIKFMVIFTVALYIFVGSFYLALRAGVTVITSTGEIVSDLELFRLETLYPWDVVFTGFRILFESGGVIDDYYANDAEGNYIGYHWFSTVMYLAFLFCVIVVLLNLLIAQMSDTYTKLQDDVEGTFIIARARIIARLQKTKWPFFGKETYKKKYYKQYLAIELSEEGNKQQQKAQEQEERLILMKKQIDNLTTMLETRTLHLTAMVESLTQHIAVERGAATPSVPLREEGDADLVFEWSDIEADDKGDDRSEEI